MSFSDDMMQKSYTQGDIDGLKQKYSRTHFTHFAMPRALKPQRVKIIKGVRYVFMFGQWRKDTSNGKKE